MYQELLQPIQSFLSCSTPDSWIEEARKPENLSVILRDHLLCELKAAQSAQFLLKRYVLTERSGQQLAAMMVPFEQFAYRRIGSLDSLRGKAQLDEPLAARPDCAYGQDMIDKMFLLIKEELHHFIQVIEVLEREQIPYEPISASRYAKGMMRRVRTFEPAALVDKLIIGAFIEARSCERFAKLAPHLNEALGRFYTSLLRSEARHYQDYLMLAEQIAGEDIGVRVAEFAQLEAALICQVDREFRFHSGIPLS